MEVNTSSTIDNANIYNYITGFTTNPAIFIVLIVIILAYVIYFATLGNNTSNDTNTSSVSSNIIIAIVVGILILLVFINLFKYFFGVDIVASLTDIFSNKPLLDIKVQQTTPPIQTTEGSGTGTAGSGSSTGTAGSGIGSAGSDQVFNIPGNYYNYNQAKTLCKAYNSRLATYDEVENSYNDGAEWCNYGWSDKQLALFPTQKSTYDKLQQVKGHENDCGRAGINGGYIDNPNINFGVNCFGKKPKMTKEEEELMHASTIYPKTNEDIRLENEVDYWKTKLDQILVSPFSHSSWNQ